MKSLEARLALAEAKIASTPVHSQPLAIEDRKPTTTVNVTTELRELNPDAAALRTFLTSVGQERYFHVRMVNTFSVHTLALNSWFDT